MISAMLVALTLSAIQGPALEVAETIRVEVTAGVAAPVAKPAVPAVRAAAIVARAAVGCAGGYCRPTDRVSIHAGGTHVRVLLWRRR
jgi:hypothetical protein